MMTVCIVKIDFVGDCCKGLINNLLSDNPNVILNKTKKSIAEWHAQRKYRVSGSRIYELFTYKRNNWICKANNYFQPKHFTTEETKHGLLQEPVAREILITKTGMNAKTFGLVVSEYNLWLGFSPDGFFFDENMKQIALLEIKYHLKNCLI